MEEVVGLIRYNFASREIGQKRNSRLQKGRRHLRYLDWQAIFDGRCAIYNGLDTVLTDHNRHLDPTAPGQQL